VATPILGVAGRKTSLHVAGDSPVVARERWLSQHRDDQTSRGSDRSHNNRR
jgi:hypothetical protein